MTTRNSSVVARAKQALKFVEQEAASGKNWMQVSNAFYGLGGRRVALFPQQEEREEFERTPEGAKIREMLLRLMKESAELSGDASGRFVVRVPKSLHAALQAEAQAEGVSLNQLCVSKLSVELGKACHAAQGG